MFDRSYYDEAYFQKYFPGQGCSWHAAAKSRGYFYRALIRRMRKAFSEAEAILVVGCGAGFFCDRLSRLPKAPRIFSSDVSEAALALVREAVGDARNITILAADAQALPFRGGIVDVVVCLDVVEHLPEPERFFLEANRALRKGGYLLFSTPNPDSLGAALKGNVARKIGAPDRDRQAEWFGYRDDSHISVKPIPEWRLLASSAGFRRAWDGSDYWWDTPYFRKVPVFLQKLLFVGSHQILTRTFGFLPWRRGENYYGIWQNEVPPIGRAAR